MQKLPRQNVLSGRAFTQGRLTLVHCSLLSLPSERELLSGVRGCLRSVFTPSTNRFALGPPPPPRGGGLLLCRTHFYPCHPRENKNRTLAHKSKAPLCKGSWIAEGKTEGLSLRKTNFQPQRAQPFELCKKESSCTEVSLHLLEGEGDRAAVK